MSGDGGRAETLRSLGVSLETSERLDALCAALIKWNRSVNLVGKTTLDSLWKRHVLDSAQVFDAADSDGGIWADFGTGGGFPGLVVAILAAERNTGFRVVCVESDARKAGFLRAAAGTLGLNIDVVAILAAERNAGFRVVCVESDARKAGFLRAAAGSLGLDIDVVARRIENAAPLGASIISARALAPLAKLLEYAERHLSPDGECVFLKGRNWRKEIADAALGWKFDHVHIPSATAPDSVVLKLGGITRV